MSSKAYNWAAMFLAFSQGTPLKDIANIYGCPPDELKRVARAQDWSALSARLPAPVPQKPQQELTTQLERVEENRRKNYQVADLLRQEIVSNLEKLRDGELRIERSWCHKSVVTTAPVKPTPQDIMSLANTAQTVANMSYRALGDTEAPDKGGEADGNHTSLTIVLPTVVADNIEKPAKPAVVDLRRGRKKPLPEPPPVVEAEPIGVEPQASATKPPSNSKELVESWGVDLPPDQASVDPPEVPLIPPVEV